MVIMPFTVEIKLLKIIFSEMVTINKLNGTQDSFFCWLRKLQVIHRVILGTHKKDK